MNKRIKIFGFTVMSIEESRDFITGDAREHLHASLATAAMKLAALFDGVDCNTVIYNGKGENLSERLSKPLDIAAAFCFLFIVAETQDEASALAVAERLKDEANKTAAKLQFDENDNNIEITKSFGRVKITMYKLFCELFNEGNDLTSTDIETLNQIFSDELIFDCLLYTLRSKGKEAAG